MTEFFSICINETKPDRIPIIAAVLSVLAASHHCHASVLFVEKAVHYIKSRSYV
jgi:hypothetical protein